MPDLEIEVMVDDNHLFVMDVESILESPEVGSVVTCRICGKKRKVKSVSSPSRKNRTAHPRSEGQKSMLEE